MRMVSKIQALQEYFNVHQEFTLDWQDPLCSKKWTKFQKFDQCLSKMHRNEQNVLSKTDLMLNDFLGVKYAVLKGLVHF